MDHHRDGPPGGLAAGGARGGRGRFSFGGEEYEYLYHPYKLTWLTERAVEVPIAVAKAAMASGVASRPIADFKAYRERLSQFVFRSGLTMKPIFERARERPQR